MDDSSSKTRKGPVPRFSEVMQPKMRRAAALANELGAAVALRERRRPPVGALVFKDPADEARDAARDAVIGAQLRDLAGMLVEICDWSPPMRADDSPWRGWPDAPDLLRAESDPWVGLFDLLERCSTAWLYSSGGWPRLRMDAVIGYRGWSHEDDVRRRAQRLNGRLVVLAGVDAEQLRWLADNLAALAEPRYKLARRPRGPQPKEAQRAAAERAARQGKTPKQLREEFPDLSPENSRKLLCEARVRLGIKPPPRSGR